MSTSAGQDVSTFDPSAWDVDGVALTAVEHLGRSSVELRSGMLLRSDLELTNFVADYDVALPSSRGFIGFVWRVRSRGDYEHFYLRSHQSGNPDACQYTPVYHGISGWQLYAGEGYNAVLEHVFGAWTHVRVVVWEDRAWIYVDSDEPVVVAKLERDVASGRLGWIVPGYAPAHFSAFRVRELVEAPPELARYVPCERSVDDEHEVLGDWRVSLPFAEALLDDTHPLEEATLAKLGPLDWTDVEASSSGLLNLARIRRIEGGASTCLVRTTIVAPVEQLLPVEFGYSDRVRVYLDGRPLYSGDNGYRTRDYRYLGTIGYFDRVVLPLLAGSNDLVFAVSESFGGWGLMARIASGSGVEVRSE